MNLYQLILTLSVFNCHQVLPDYLAGYLLGVVAAQSLADSTVSWTHTRTRPCTHTHTRTRTHTHMHTHARAHTHTRTQTRARTHAHTHTHVHTHAHTHTHMHTHTRTHTHAHTHTHTRAHTHTRTHIHAHTHAHCYLEQHLEMNKYLPRDCFLKEMFWTSLHYLHFICVKVRWLWYTSRRTTPQPCLHVFKTNDLWFSLVFFIFLFFYCVSKRVNENVNKMCSTVIKHRSQMSCS